jgi:hypothetical protein
MQGGLAPPLRSPAASGGSCLRSRERSNNGSLAYEAALRSLRGSRGTGLARLAAAMLAASDAAERPQSHFVR